MTYKVSCYTKLDELKLYNVIDKLFEFENPETLHSNFVCTCQKF